MTDAALNATENGTGENADIEDGSDDGSDIFMPGGITMKSTEISNEAGDQNDDKEAISKQLNDTTDDVNMSIDEEQTVVEASAQETSASIDNVTYVPEEEKTMEENVKNIDNEKIDEQEKSFESPSSPESCLEINIDGEESAFPSSNKEKILNSQRKEKEKEDLEERNIFMNSEIFDEDEEIKKNPQEQEGPSSLPKNEDDEHNMSDDFKIGLNQKSFEGDPFCPDKPRPYETTERNIYLIDKLAIKYYLLICIWMQKHFKKIHCHNVFQHFIEFGCLLKSLITVTL